MTESLILRGGDNWLYFGTGQRQYGRMPVIGHPRAGWEFQFILDGRATATSGRAVGRHGEKAPGAGTPRLLISRPGAAHGWTDTPEGRTEVLVFHFRQVPAELGDWVPADRALGLALTPKEVSRWRASAAEWRRAWPPANQATSLRATSLLVELTCWIAEKIAPHAATPAGRRVPADALVERCLNWAAEHLTEKPTAAALARIAGCSPAHLRRLFAVSGRGSPRAELDALRLNRARRFLEQGWRLGAIAELLGYSEASAFSRAFKRADGEAPGKCRRRRGPGS